MNDWTKESKLMAKRMLAIFMIMILCCLSGSAALADGSWTCPNCGQEGNTGNFCGNCAAARPSEEWVCPNCGQVNTTNFCTNCAAAKPSGGQPAEAAPAAVNDQLEQIPGESDHVKVKVQSVSGNHTFQTAETQAAGSRRRQRTGMKRPAGSFPPAESRP